MKQEELESALRQIREIADAALGVGNPVSKALKKSKRAVVSTEKASLTDHILALRDQEFFKQPMTANEVHVEVEKIYPCDLNRVEVALIRMHKRRELRKSSKTIEKKQKIAYVW